MHVLSKKPTHVWFTPRVSHEDHTHGPFKLWVICTVHTVKLTTIWIHISIILTVFRHGLRTYLWFHTWRASWVQHYCCKIWHLSPQVFKDRADDARAPNNIPLLSKMTTLLKVHLAIPFTVPQQIQCHNGQLSPPSQDKFTCQEYDKTLYLLLHYLWRHTAVNFTSFEERAYSFHCNTLN